jgi:hypothetical protein
MGILIGESFQLELKLEFELSLIQFKFNSKQGCQNQLKFFHVHRIHICIFIIFIHLHTQII